MEDADVPLLSNVGSGVLKHNKNHGGGDECFLLEAWRETKDLWHIVGPAIFSLLSSFTMFVITIGSAGHLGDTEFAAMSLACNVILGIDYSLLLGMSSALETLCGQAFGARNYRMMGIYLQRSWVILFVCCVAMLPLFIFTTPLLKLLGMSAEVADLAGLVAVSFIPLHFSMAFQFPLQRFLQSQLKNDVIAWANSVALVVHLILNWLVLFKLKVGLVAITLALGVSWWVLVLVLLGYSVSGACPDSWPGFSFEAFSGLWPFLKLSISSGVMICLENWYYQILLLIAGRVGNPVSFDALTVCMTTNGWEFMIHCGFFIGTGVRVANELGAGNGRKAKFATMVSVTESVVVGIIFWFVIMFFHNQIALAFTSSKPVLEEVSKLSIFLAFTVLLNSVQPILSGVAVGSGWQSYVAYINLGCYYIIGLPLGVLMGWVFRQGVLVSFF
ncbi:OLC1v1011246C1 [Oldenlandia corymbosa var. corymbosa]|uniref:OLC1v1011246C1 n=1 Tax=Oldenlandia corymbosa var. corymbosa TaxID=529605 RepID=A0AAV1DUY1_OLDCO|nr:OLC1v1011246C1 [Oldenlandia corymbosa var. corymbosa]